VLDVPEPQLAAAVTNVWASKASAPSVRGHAAAGVVNGLLYVAGGDDGDTTGLRSMRAYNPSTNTWAIKAPLPAGRWTPGAGVINGVLYVAGGTDQAFTPARTLYAYNLATNTWATKASMLEPLGVCPRQVSA
jgi:N-acetylneuraminic acid mutarotase